MWSYRQISLKTMRTNNLLIVGDVWLLNKSGARTKEKQSSQSVQMTYRLQQVTEVKYNHRDENTESKSKKIYRKTAVRNLGKTVDVKINRNMLKERYLRIELVKQLCIVQ